MNLPSTMRGGIAGMLITLLVIAIVGGATYFAVSSMLGGEDASAQATDEKAVGLTKADAQRIGREEGAKVARDIAYEAALDVAQASGGSALYGDSYASAETTDYGSYASDDDSATADSGDYGSYSGTADSSSYDSYGGGASSDDTSSSASADDSGSDDYGSDNYDSYDYGSSDSGSTESTSTDSASDDYASDDYGSDDYASDDYASDDYGSDDYGSDDYGSDSTADSGTSDSSSTQTASTAPARSDPDEPEPKVTGKAPPPATVIAPWWPPAKDQSSGAMKVLYAGTFAGGDGKGLGVLFGEAVKSGQSFGNFIKVIDDKGATVDVDWTLATNPALLKTGGLKRGRYLVQLKPGLQSAQGRIQGLSLEGPIFIE